MPIYRKKIIIIKGAPGSGKSQTAKSLSQYYTNGIRLEVDAIRQMVISVDWTNQQEHINMLKVCVRLIESFLSLDFNPVIVVDTFSGNKINGFIDLMSQLKYDLTINNFALYTSDAELRRRLDLRLDNKFKDYQVCKKLNEDVIRFKREDEVLVDTTTLTPTQTAEIIYRHINTVK